MPTETARSTYHHGNLPHALVEASLRLVRAHGVDGFSLRAAAREAGVHPAAVYRHFADRSELLGAVALVGFGRLADRMAVAMASRTDPESRFTAAGDAYVRFAVDNPAYFHVMFGPYGSGPRGAARNRGAGSDGRSAYALLVEMLAELRAVGRIDDPVESATLTVWSALHGLAALLVDGAVVLTDGEVDEAIERATRSALRGLAPRD